MNTKILDGFSLKLIAIISMTIDHVGAILFPQYLVFRMIGRIAFPIYCFLLVEGLSYTKDVKKYLLRLLAFAFISEIPFDMGFFQGISFGHQNVFFELALAMAAIYIYDKYSSDMGRPVAKRLMGALAFAGAMVLGDVLHFDYGATGVAMVFIFYLLKKSKLKWQKILCLLLFVWLNFSPVQMYGILALIPIYFYNGRRGIGLKYLFYGYYPIHLSILAIIYYVKSLGAF